MVSDAKEISNRCCGGPALRHGEGHRKRRGLPDADRDHFLERLGEILQDTQTLCYAWVPIPSHIVMAMEARELKTGKISD